MNTNRFQGHTVRVADVVIDVEFHSGDLPSIDNALLIHTPDDRQLVVEVQEHLGPSTIS